MKWSFHIVLLMSLACVKPDVQLEPPGDSLITVESDIQRPKAFLDLHTRAVDEPRDRNFWHLRFQNGVEQWGVYLNPFIDLSVHPTEKTDFKADLQEELSTADWRKDILEDGVLTSAIGDWGDFTYANPSSYQRVYLLAVASKTDTVYFKFQMLNVKDGDYWLRYAPIDSTNGEELAVRKDPYRTHSYLNLEAQANQVEVEPLKKDWQLEFTFTPDSTYADNAPPLYVVGGVELFPTLFFNSAVEFALDTTRAYEDLGYFDIRMLDYMHLPYINNPFIRYDRGEERYVANPQVVMLCRWSEQYCKMQLTDLEYGSNGQLVLNLRLQNL